MDRFLLTFVLACMALSPPTVGDQSPKEREVVKANPDEDLTVPTGSKLRWMKRNFAQGQPELQQAMDNMLIREQMIKRNIQFPPVNVDGYPALLTHKTAYLLEEAEHMLNRVKNLRERRWVEAFVHRLKLLASLLQKSVATTEAPAENKGLNISTRGNIQSFGTLGENNRPFTTSSVPSIAPGINQEQSAKESSKILKTSSQLRDISQPSQDDRQEKSGLVQQLRNKKLYEGDELVQELENFKNAAPLKNHPQNAISPVATTISPDRASSVPPKRMYASEEDDTDIEMEKEKIRNILIQEAEALQRLGGTPEEIMKTLQLDNRFIDFKDPESGFNQNPIAIESETNSFENRNSEVKEMHSEGSMISKTNRYVLRPSTQVHPASYPSKDMYMNRSFQGMHMNLPPMNQQMLSRQLQNGPKHLPHAAMHMPHYSGNKNAVQKLPGLDYQFNNHIVHDPQTLQNDQHGIRAPMEAKQNHFLQNNGNHNFNPSLGLYRSVPGNKHGYSPYPYFPNIHHKNETIYGTQIYPSYSMNNNFSDEMKRQLRDGKVILLSDSVVRSNFEPTPDKDKSDKGKKEAPAEIAKSEGKKETQAQK